MILLDTSILIDYFRKQNKSKSILFNLFSKYNEFAVSVITEYEIYKGSNEIQNKFWEEFFKGIKKIALDSEIIKRAVVLEIELKRKNLLIDIPDLFIAATAINENISLSTLNTKHFERVNTINLI
jgi:tRNA(fMet)-specific endonuclease VapC